MHFKYLSGLAVSVVLLAASCGSDADNNSTAKVDAAESAGVDPAFDLVSSQVSSTDNDVVFRHEVAGDAGATLPDAVGSLDGAPVVSYVWPTTLDSSAVGFDTEQGILSLAATAHPDFDDTPLHDENGDGDNANDGALWHSHWVVLVENGECGGGLTVKDIPEGDDAVTPSTWPGLPILIDSPNFDVDFDGGSIEIEVSASDIGEAESFSFDGVSSRLRVSTAAGDPLLCVEEVFDVASGDLSLPATLNR